MHELKINDSKVVDSDEIVPPYVINNIETDDDDEDYLESSDEEYESDSMIEDNNYVLENTRRILELSREYEEESVGPDTEDEEDETDSEVIDLLDDMESVNIATVSDQSGEISASSNGSAGDLTSEKSIVPSGSNAEGESAPEPLDSATAKDAAARDTLLLNKMYKVVEEIKSLQASLKEGNLEVLPDKGEELRRQVDEKKKELQSLTDEYKSYGITPEPTDDQFNLSAGILRRLRRTIVGFNFQNALQKEIYYHLLEKTQGWLRTVQQWEIIMHELNDGWESYKITHEPLSEDLKNIIAANEQLKPLVDKAEELRSQMYKWKEELDGFCVEIGKLVLEYPKKSNCETN